MRIAAVLRTSFVLTPIEMPKPKDRSYAMPGFHYE